MILSALDLVSREIDEHARGWCRGADSGAVFPVPTWSGS